MLMLSYLYLYSFKLLHISVYERINDGFEDTKTILIIRKFREKKRQKNSEKLSIIRSESRDSALLIFFGPVFTV